MVERKIHLAKGKHTAQEKEVVKTVEKFERKRQGEKERQRERERERVSEGAALSGATPEDVESGKSSRGEYRKNSVRGEVDGSYHVHAD